MFRFLGRLFRTIQEWPDWAIYLLVVGVLGVLIWLFHLTSTKCPRCHRRSTTPDNYRLRPCIRCFRCRIIFTAEGTILHREQRVVHIDDYRNTA